MIDNNSGWWYTYPSENMKVNWDYYSQYMEKYNIFQTINSKCNEMYLNCLFEWFGRISSQTDVRENGPATRSATKCIPDLDDLDDHPARAMVRSSGIEPTSKGLEGWWPPIFTPVAMTYQSQYLISIIEQAWYWPPTWLRMEVNLEQPWTLTI